MLLFASLRTGKASVLARLEWKEVLRAECSDEELQEQELFGVLADCTVLNAELNDMLANWASDVEKSIHRRDRIRQDALTLLTHLRAWRERWDLNVETSYSKTPAAFIQNEPARERPEDENPPFLTVFNFSNQYAALMLMFYNTTLLYVFRILASLPAESLDIGSDHNLIQSTLQFVAHSNGPWKYNKDEFIAVERMAALEVCRCIPSYSDEKFHPNPSPIVH
jgi:hypothetical protein